MLGLSVIIISYNTRDLTIECVESVFNDGSKIDFEAVVVDNGSKDGSVGGLRGLWRKYPKLKLIENKVNLGFAKAVNLGIKNRSGEHVYLLNSDARIVGKTLERLVKFAERTEDAGVVGTKLINPDGTVQPSCYNFPSIKNAIKEYFLGIEGAYEKFSPKGSGDFIVESVVGASFLITRKALQKVGVLDEKYFMYFEDLDYCRRVRKADLNVYYLSELKVIHEHGQSGKKSSKEQYQKLVESSKIFNGILNHTIINGVIWVGQKLRTTS